MSIITLMYGDLFESKADAIVNPINCVGVMGGGLALEFKNRYPEMFKVYVDLCKAGHLTPGTIYGHRPPSGPVVLNFPTKDHWKDPSLIKYIHEGLPELISTMRDMDLKSVAIPALGCGLGGLNWADVEPVIRKAFKDTDLEVHLYPPYNS